MSRSGEVSLYATSKMNGPDTNDNEVEGVAFRPLPEIAIPIIEYSFYKY